MATTNAFCLASPPLAHLPSRGFTTIWPPPRPVCEHGSGSHPGAVVTGAGFPSDERGWYQIRIAGEDTAPEAVYARLHEQLGEAGHPHCAATGRCRRADCRLCWGRRPSWSFITAGASMALWGSALAASGFCRHDAVSLGASMILGGVAQMLARRQKTPDYRATDNGKQNTYFSSLDNMIAQGNPIPVPYGKCWIWLPPYISGQSAPVI